MGVIFNRDDLHTSHKNIFLNMAVKNKKPSKKSFIEKINGFIKKAMPLIRLIKIIFF